MPDALLLSLDSKSFFELEALAQRHGFRTKSTTEPKTASEWLNLKPFDVLFLDARLEFQIIQDLAMRLWKTAPESPAIAFDLEGTLNPEVSKSCRLFGVDVVSGPSSRAELESTLAGLGQRAKGGANSKRILVVEDLDSPRDIICFYLESLGFASVQGVRSAREAIAALEREPAGYSCVITDVRMPGMSGKELIEFVRRHQSLRNVPMIALTAYGTVDTLIDCLKAGASGFLVKPPKRDDLLRELARAVRISANRANPRLANEQEADLLRNLLIERGFS